MPKRAAKSKLTEPERKAKKQCLEPTHPLGTDTNAVGAGCAEPAELKTASRKQKGDKVSTIPRLESLATELLQDIYLKLDPGGQLAFKLTSRTLRSATRKGDGSELVPFGPQDDHYKHEVGELMLKIEMNLPEEVKVEKLTCSCCHRCCHRATWDGDDTILPWKDAKDHELCAPRAFPDGHFDRARLDRTCIHCMVTDTCEIEYYVDGKHCFACQGEMCQVENAWYTEVDAPSREGIADFERRYKACQDEDEDSEVRTDPTMHCDECFQMLEEDEICNLED